MSKKIRSRRLLIIILGVIILVFGVAGYYVYGQYFKSQEAKEAVETTEKEEEAKETKTETKKEYPYTLVGYTGEVFGAKVPKGWNITDNESGIEIIDNNDSQTGASGIVAVGWYGKQTPDGFIEYMLKAIGAKSINYIQSSDQETITDPNSGLKWQMKSKTFTFVNKGQKLKAKASAGVLNGYGQFMGMIIAFQTTPAKWKEWAPTLERIAKSITIINPSKAGGIDKVRLPTAADLKNDSSPLMESWEYRNRVGDWSSHEWSDAILGQETDLYSPSTGRSYTRPLTDYDPTIGGYRNPDNRSEILVDPYDR